MQTLLGAIEGGGTWFRCAVGRADGTLQAQIRFPTAAPAETLARAAAWLAPHAPAAVGIGCFGPLDLRRGRLGRTPKPGWSGADLLGPLRALGVPLALHTDVTAAALGEAGWGAGQGADSLLYLTVGTGIGGGFLPDGRHPPGRAPLHPEAGHLPLPRQPDEAAGFSGVCPFHTDCLEGLASGPALQARWGQPAETLPAEHPAWDLEARYLAAGLRAMLAVAAPARVVIGGGVGSSPALWPRLRPRLREALASYWPDIEPDTWIVPAGLGDHAALVGGLWLAAQETI